MTSNKIKKIFILLMSLVLITSLIGCFEFEVVYKPEPDPIPEPQPEPEPQPDSNLNPDTGLPQDINGFYYYDNTGYEIGSYYYSAYNKEGEALKEELHKIVNTNFNRVSYGDARYVLSYSDRVTVDGETYVLGMYDNDKIDTKWIGSGAGAWQREHVWPNSKLGMDRVSNTQRNQASDLHNLRAITGINQSRSNRYFTNPLNNKKEAHTVGSEAFYPSDEHKGDVARILFYMVVAYKFLNLTDDTSHLINNSATNYTMAGAYQGELSVLLQWHKEDPVSEFEIQRNEFIYSGIALNPDGGSIRPQGNRNPFIDNPEYAHLIFEGKTIQDITRPKAVETEPISYNIIDLLKVNQTLIIEKRIYIN